MYTAFYSMFGRRKLNLLRTANKKKIITFIFSFLKWGEISLCCTLGCPGMLRVGFESDIRKTCPCNDKYPLKPHFYIANLGYAGV